MEIRHVELQDKAGWYLLDRHLPEDGFDEKIRNKQGYILVDEVIDVPTLDESPWVYECEVANNLII